MAMTTSSSIRVNPARRSLRSCNIANPPEPKDERNDALVRPTCRRSSIRGRFVSADELHFLQVAFGYRQWAAADVGDSPHSVHPLALVSQDRKHPLVVGRTAHGIGPPDHHV